MIKIMQVMKTSLKPKPVLGICCAILLTQTLYASSLSVPAIDVFLLPGQNAENMENLNVNACTVVDLRQAQLAMQHQLQALQEQRLTQDKILSQVKTSSQALSQQVQCVSYAHALGVKRFPAIVFNGQAVVYGMTDVQVALDVYQDKVQQKIDEQLS